MKADYHISEFILQMLEYSLDEIHSITEVIKKGLFSYMPIKYKYSTDKSKGASGLDIPTMWLQDDSTYKKTIMLLAQDPLRNTKYWDHCMDETITAENRMNYTIIGTPYALHVHDTKIKHALRLNVSIYRNLIERLISEKECRVYCTDIFKYYPNDKIIKKFDIDLLNMEIKTIKPDIIICMGSFACNAINQLHPCCEKIIRTPHPRARSNAWNAWREENNKTTTDYTDNSKILDILNEVQ